MTICSKMLAVALTAATLLTGPALAQESAAPAPAIQSQGSVTYLSGGITADERDAMKPVAKDYNLRLMFALNVGSYVANVKVKITNGKGKTVLETISEGPWLYVKLPAGKYKISADYHDKIVTKSATVTAKKGASATFIWPGVKEQVDD